jgi:hypothetical protein
MVPAVRCVPRYSPWPAEPVVCAQVFVGQWPVGSPTAQVFVPMSVAPNEIELLVPACNTQRCNAHLPYGIQRTPPYSMQHATLQRTPAVRHTTYTCHAQIFAPMTIAARGPDRAAGYARWGWSATHATL